MYQWILYWHKSSLVHMLLILMEEFFRLQCSQSHNNLHIFSYALRQHIITKLSLYAVTKIFKIRSAQTDKNFFISPRPIFTPMSTHHINIIFSFLFGYNQLGNTNMLKHNIFDTCCNGVFESFVSDLEMYKYLTIHTLDIHTNQFFIIFVFKHNHNHINNL